MKSKSPLKSILIGLLLCSPPVLAVGESAVITLVFPYGTSSLGMAEVGTAISEDYSAPFFNPALLGLNNTRWHGGEGAWFYEPILPSFAITDLWHLAVGACYQPRLFDAGGFGFYLNYLNFGYNTWTDESGRRLGGGHSYERVTALSWGSPIGRPGREFNALGVSVKHVYSALAPGFGPGDEGIGRTFAIDAGYAFFHRESGFRAGLTFANMGPSIFYIEREESDPIPFEINIALGYDKTCTYKGIDFLRVRSEYRIQRELVQVYPEQRPAPFWKAIYKDIQDKNLEKNWEAVTQHTGVEFTAFNTISWRYGYMHDITGWRYELTYGFGIQLFNHFQFNYANISEPNNEYLIRTDQWRIDATAFRLFNWRKEDAYWWKNQF